MSIKRRTVLAGAAAIPLLGWLNEFNAQTVVRTRPSVYTSAATSHIASLRTGVAAMKVLPSTDRRNWIRIADIHRNSCQHRQWWFPFWHRLYVLHFEAIVRQQSGNSAFVLPYWDYAANRAMPPAFRQPAATSNALWTSRRSASINGGGALPSSAVSATTAMNTLPYLSNGSVVGFGGPRVSSATLRGPGARGAGAPAARAGAHGDRRQGWAHEQCAGGGSGPDLLAASLQYRPLDRGLVPLGQRAGLPDRRRCLDGPGIHLHRLAGQAGDRQSSRCPLHPRLGVPLSWHHAPPATSLGRCCRKDGVDCHDAASIRGSDVVPSKAGRSTPAERSSSCPSRRRGAISTPVA